MQDVGIASIITNIIVRKQNIGAQEYRLGLNATNLKSEVQKMTERVWIGGKFPTANEYIEACRRNIYAANKLKKETEMSIMWQISKLSPVDRPARYFFEWHEKTMRRDKDNVSFAQKFVFDALQKAGKLPNDNNKYVAGFEHDFVYGVDQGLFLTIKELDDI